MNKNIVIVWDFDLTISEEYQQVPLFTKRFTSIKNQLESEGYKCQHPLDYFGYVDSDKRRVQGVGYLQQMVYDARPGKCLEGLSNEELFALGKKVTPAPGFVECILQLKKEFNDIKITHFIVSVGLKPMIEGFLEHHNLTQEFADVAASEFETDSNGIICGIRQVVTPFTKNQFIIGFMKGDQSLLNEQLNPDSYAYSYQNMIVIGDGYSDTAKFAYAKKRGGTPIAVYEEKNISAFNKTNETVGMWVDYILQRNYMPGTPNFNILKEIIQKKANNSQIVRPSTLYDFKRGKIKNKDEFTLIKHAILTNPDAQQYFEKVIVKPDGTIERTTHKSLAELQKETQLHL